MLAVCFHPLKQNALADTLLSHSSHLIPLSLLPPLSLLHPIVITLTLTTLSHSPGRVRPQRRSWHCPLQEHTPWGLMRLCGASLLAGEQQQQQQHRYPAAAVAVVAVESRQCRHLQLLLLLLRACGRRLWLSLNLLHHHCDCHCHQQNHHQHHQALLLLLLLLPASTPLQSTLLPWGLWV